MDVYTKLKNCASWILKRARFSLCVLLNAKRYAQQTLLQSKELHLPRLLKRVLSLAKEDKLSDKQDFNYVLYGNNDEKLDKEGF